MNQIQSVALKAQIRIIKGKQVKTLRNQGFVPAVVYGNKLDNIDITISKIELKKALAEAGYSTLIDLKIDDDKSIKVIASEPQFDPRSDEFIHVDFYKVKMDEKIKTEIPLEFIGESEAIKSLEGSLVQNKDSVEVECLPGDLVGEIQVDISVLKTFDDSIHVSDIKVPQGIEILDEAEEMIASVEPPRSEEELAELETPSAAEEEKEAIEKMGAEATVEGEEPAEGEPENTQTSKTE